MDKSGSMRGEPLQRAKDAALRWLAHLSPADEVALVAFGTQPEVILPMQPALPNALQQAQTAIAALSARGGTHLSGGLQLAMAEAQRARQTVRRIILLSDGVPTEGNTQPHAFVALARRGGEEGLTLSALALGSQSPGGLMERLATASGGTYRFLRSSADVGSALEQELAWGARMVAHDARVVVALPPGVTVRSVHGAAADGQRGTVELRVGEIAYGVPRHVHVRLAVPGNNALRLPFSLTARAWVGGQPAEANDTLVAVRTDNDAILQASKTAWVEVRGELALAADEVARAAEAISSGHAARGKMLLKDTSSRLANRAAQEPMLRLHSQAVDELATQSDENEDRGALSNRAHERAFALTH
jgi:hypothetical protein